MTDDVVRPDARSLRALTHPLRLRLLGLLRAEGPATATRLAALTGESTGSTSYHLRRLAADGFVVEDAGRGSARDRWWRAAHRSTYLDPQVSPDLPPEVREENLAVGEQYLRVVAELGHARVLDNVDRLATLDDDLGPGWSEGFTMSDYALRLTLAETRDLVAALEALADARRQDDPERRHEAPEGTQRVVLQFAVLPQPPLRPVSREES